jgi:precorrin-4/cobalt-precorrin-4 C11-methyltransferase
MNSAKGKVYFIGAGPGDPELITLKGRRLLDEADIVVYAGSLVNQALLGNIKAMCYDSARLHLEEIVTIMEQGVLSGKQVVRLHSGDPCLYGAIKEQIVYLKSLGIPYEIVPGVSSATAAAAVLQEELTRPEVSQTVIITRYSGKTPVPERERLRNLAVCRATMLIFLSIQSIEDVVAELCYGYSDTTPAAVVYKATWPEQKIIRGNLKTIAQQVQEAGIRKTAIIVVGSILDKEFEAVSKLYDKTFAHGYREDS